jgi:hypothetical protein
MKALMNKRTPLDFDISVSADKKRRAKRRDSTGAFEASGRVCYHRDCNLEGKYRAPKSPELINEFNWFCVKHVREYNSKWNFFENHSSEELEKQLRDDAVWSRKTKPIGKDNNKVHTEGRSWARMGFNDPHEILGDKGTHEPSTDMKSTSMKRLPASERKALEILDARDTMTKPQIRKIYKALVKDLHPDMNGGRRDDEERLAEVVWAWEQIKTSRSFK